ncbi:MAG: PorT family protein [Tannerella sp.]|jgi:hypothetical protein|nr:PorT family protein [Tannerella sp.]
MNRKKWFLPVLMALMVFATSATYAQLHFGVKGGVNISTVKFDKDVIASDNITGFHIGPMIEFMPGAIGVDAALLYSQKGFKDERDNENVKINYIDVPVNLKIKLAMPLVSPYFAAGPYMSFLVGGDKVYNFIGSTSSSIQEQLKAKSFGAGLNFTVGAEVVSRLQVGLTYSWGLTDNYSEFDSNDLDEYRGKPHTWMISAAVLF